VPVAIRHKLDGAQLAAVAAELPMAFVEVLADPFVGLGDRLRSLPPAELPIADAGST